MLNGALGRRFFISILPYAVIRLHVRISLYAVILTHVRISLLAFLVLRKKHNNQLPLFILFNQNSVLMSKSPAVYILTNRPQGTLYLGVTSDLIQRIWQHKNHAVPGFTARYNVYHLVYFEMLDDMYTAISREKQLKNWKRAWKIQLIEQTNPQWRDLWNDICS